MHDVFCLSTRVLKIIIKYLLIQNHMFTQDKLYIVLYNIIILEKCHGF
jgi:hypothetical protein